MLARLGECRQRGCGILWSVHDLNMAAQYADRILLLKDSRLVAAGTPQEVLVPSLLEAVFGIRTEVIPIRGVPHVVQLGFVGEG